MELASDFTMPYGEDDKLLPYELIQKPYFQEELNILYVAITRAKRYLRLSPEVAKLLADLGATPSEKLHAPQGRADYLHETRVGDAARWKLFEKEVRQSESFEITVETVPFPHGPEHNILALPDSLTMEEAQRLVSEALLRWHPDKFLGCSDFVELFSFGSGYLSVVVLNIGLRRVSGLPGGTVVVLSWSSSAT